MEEKDFLDSIMGFDPKDLSVFKEQVSNTNVNPNVYKTNPKDSISEDGHYRSIIRILYNPFNVKNSVVKQAKYALKDENGFFMADSSLAIGDKSCPLFTAWKKLWFSGDEDKKAFAKEMFQKNESQWVLVQVVEDENQPDAVGKLKVMKLPKAIFDSMTAKMNPSPESKKQPVALMDYLFGKTLEIDVQPGPDDPKHPERKQREISYSLCEFTNDIAPVTKVDGTQLLTDEEYDIVSRYDELKTGITKARTATDKSKKMEEAKSLVPEIKEIYKKVLDYLKENAPNLEDECGYKPWGDELAARVNAWIEKVLKGENPVQTTTPSVQEAVVDAFDEPEGVDMADDDDEDLPF